jgi:hypothetical protein
MGMYIFGGSIRCSDTLRGATLLATVGSSSRPPLAVSRAGIASIGNANITTGECIY